MSGPVSQSESNVIAQRAQNIAKVLLGAVEEIRRLKSLNASLNLATYLDAPSSGVVSKAEIIAFFTGPLFDFEDWFDNQTVASDGTAGSNDRRAKIDPFLVTDEV